MEIKLRIEKLLNTALQPDYLEVVDNSHLHIGHSGHKEGGQTHFAITIKTDELDKLSKVKAHQAIYKILQPLMNNPIHALEIKLQP